MTENSSNLSPTDIASNITVPQKVPSVNTSISERIYDEIKYLYKAATGKELTAIEKVKKEFDRTWKELEKKGAAEVIEADLSSMTGSQNSEDTVNNSASNITVPQKVPSVNTSISERIYDEIKYLYKAATGKEVTAIEKVKKEFDRTWKELEKKGAAEVVDVDGKLKNSAQYSISYTTDNSPVVVVEDNILDGVPKSQWIQTVKNTISEKFSNGIPISGRLVKVNSVTRNEYTNSKNTQYLRASDGSVYSDKFKSANNIDEIVLASTNYVNEDLNHKRKDNIKEFARGDVLIRVGNNDYSAKVIIGFTGGKNMVLYDIINFTPTEFSIKKIENTSGLCTSRKPKKGCVLY